MTFAPVNEIVPMLSIVHYASQIIDQVSLN